MRWRRYQFHTRSVEDVRPLVFNPHYPWWHTGTAGDGSFASIVAYLPVDEDLTKYWDDASDVQFIEEETITFSGRFPQPAYFQLMPREANQLGILCAECFELCVLSEDKKRWLCPNGHN